MCFCIQAYCVLLCTVWDIPIITVLWFNFIPNAVMDAFVIIAATLFPRDALHSVFIKERPVWGTLWVAACNTRHTVWSSLDVKKYYKIYNQCIHTSLISNMLHICPDSHQNIHYRLMNVHTFWAILCPLAGLKCWFLWTSLSLFPNPVFCHNNPIMREHVSFLVDWLHFVFLWCTDSFGLSFIKKTSIFQILGLTLPPYRSDENNPKTLTCTGLC